MSKYFIVEIKCDNENNPPEIIKNGEMNITFIFGIKGTTSTSYVTHSFEKEKAEALMDLFCNGLKLK